jgi:hypothetical protein
MSLAGLFVPQTCFLATPSRGLNGNGSVLSAQLEASSPMKCSFRYAMVSSCVRGTIGFPVWLSHSDYRILKSKEQP